MSALTANFVTNYGRGGGACYQWGRKDPFFGIYALYNINGVALTATAPTTFAAQQWNTNKPVVTAGAVSIITGIKNPMVFYTKTSGNLDWSTFETTVGVWNDVKVPVTNYVDKSIFDPCPPGWMVPTQANQVWMDFQFGKTANNASRGLNIANGWKYYPYYTPDGGATYPVDGSITYFTNIELQYDIGIYVGSAAQSWGTARPVGAGTLNSMDTASINETFYKAQGFQVRCISMPPKP